MAAAARQEADDRASKAAAARTAAMAPSASPATKEAADRAEAEAATAEAAAATAEARSSRTSVAHRGNQNATRNPAAAATAVAIFRCTHSCQIDGGYVRASIGWAPKQKDADGAPKPGEVPRRVKILTKHKQCFGGHTPSRNIIDETVDFSDCPTCPDWGPDPHRITRVPVDESSSSSSQGGSSTAASKRVASSRPSVEPLAKQQKKDGPKQRSRAKV